MLVDGGLVAHDINLSSLSPWPPMFVWTVNSRRFEYSMIFGQVSSAVQSISGFSKF